MSRSILILGATSSLAQRIICAVVKPSDKLVIAGRDENELEIIAANLQAREDICAFVHAFDATAFSSHRNFSAGVMSSIGAPDIIIIATGALGDQFVARTDEKKILEIGASNFLGIATATASLIEAMESRGSGRLIVLSSVAGDRGRASNYVYGAGKAGINAYFSGLRGRLYKSGVTATTVKLGFVDTQMVFGKAGTFLVADPDWIAKKINELIERPRDIVYLPRFWFFIMLIIRMVPEFIFKRLPL